MWGEQGIQVEDELGQRDYGVGKWEMGARTLHVGRCLEVSGLCTETIRKLVLHSAGEGEQGIR